MNSSVFYYIVALVFVLSIWNCKEDENFTDDPGKLLEFSVDTLNFDTVFTERGSATRIFKLYNRHDEYLRVEAIELDNADSKFIFNVDGFFGPEINELELAPGDSTYAFVEVVVDPNEPISASPFIIEEEMIFKTNGQTQSILLQAWGQNAVYLPGVNQGNSISLLSCDNGTIDFNDERPYVIFGALIIDSCTLNLPPGARIYVHGGFGVNDEIIFNGGFILVGANGNIVSDGSIEDPVIWSTDRLEESFQDDGGQWAGIRLLSGSTGNVFRNTQIRNSIIGIEVDSAANLILDKTQILTTSGSALTGIHSTIVAENCLFADNGGASFQAVQGGSYDFKHCTFRNTGTEQAAVALSNFRCADFPVCNFVLINDLQAQFQNCIIDGTLNDIIQLSNVEDAGFNYSFDHCLIRTDEITDDYPDFFDNCQSCFERNFSDPLFLAAEDLDFSLDTMSIVIDKGIDSSVDDDILGNPRNADEPDLGCYEFQK